MSSLQSLLIGTLCLAHATSCANDSPARPTVAAYLATAATWAPAEAETARAIDRIIATQFIDHAAIRNEIFALRPRVERHIDRVRDLTPEGTRLKAIHLHYVDLWRGLSDTLTLLEHSMDRADAIGIAGARAGFIAWRRGIADTASSLRQLQGD